MSENEPNTPDYDEEIVAAAMVLLRRTLEQHKAGCEYRRINEFFGDSTDCVFIKDSECRILFVNEAFRMTFAPTVEPVGMKGSDFLPFDMRLISERTDSKVLDEAIPISFVHATEVAGREKTSFSITKLPVLGEEGTIGLIGLARQIRAGVALPNTLELQSKLGLLNENEMKVVEMVGRGYLNKQIAKECNVSLRTIENRRQRVMKKLQVHSTAEMVRLIVRMEDIGLLQSP